MPKLLVVFHGGADDDRGALPQGAASRAPSRMRTLADAAADGAASVRFTEVDVRAVDVHVSARDYDGVLIVVPTRGELPSELDAFLSSLEREQPVDAFLNTVFAVAGEDLTAPAALTALVSRVARLGGIIVSEPRGHHTASSEERARVTGKRAAKVIEWVRHGLGHEHAHATHSHHHH